MLQTETPAAQSMAAPNCRGCSLIAAVNLALYDRFADPGIPALPRAESTIVAGRSSNGRSPTHQAAWGIIGQILPRFRATAFSIAIDSLLLFQSAHQIPDPDEYPGKYDCEKHGVSPVHWPAEYVVPEHRQGQKDDHHHEPRQGVDLPGVAPTSLWCFRVTWHTDQIPRPTGLITLFCVAGLVRRGQKSACYGAPGDTSARGGMLVPFGSENRTTGRGEQNSQATRCL